MAADADITPEYMERLANENGAYTVLFWRINDADAPVRDAHVLIDAGSYEVAVGMFASIVAANKAEDKVGVCAVVRGQVETVDDIECADEPEMDDAAQRHLVELNGSLAGRRQYTVFGSWDTGDGHKRYAKVVNAISPLHAEMLVRADKTMGDFYVAGVLDGCVPHEDPEDAVWTTPDGQPAPPPRRRRWWQPR